jgi:GNAT superfamily N-acetyltransferase
MTTRADMTIRLQPVALESVPGMRAPTVDDKPGLARLLLDAYRGTVHDEGETIEQAFEEIERVFRGECGPVMLAESIVVERQGQLASATLLTRWQNRPFVAHAITLPAWQRRGLARASMTSCMSRLHEQGEQWLSLTVTLENEPAVVLYKSLGFQMGR